MSCLCTLHVQDTGRGARQVVGLQVQILQRGEPVERGELKLILDKLTRRVHVSKMRCKLSLDLPDAWYRRQRTSFLLHARCMNT